MFKEIYIKKLVNTVFDEVNLISGFKSPTFCREYCIWMLESIEWPTLSKEALNKVCFK